MNNIEYLKNIYYINLDTRPDRKFHVENELKKIHAQCKRFNAIKMNNGAIGCSASHLEVLKIAQREKADHVCIVEDDIQFLNPLLFLSQLKIFLSNHNDWDVILIAGNNKGDFQIMDETCIRVTNCNTTTGYIVKNRYFETLIKNVEEGIAKFENEPNKPMLYAIDQYWATLQKIDKWYLIIPLSVVQRCDYSNIEKRATNYSKVMLDLDKHKYKNISD